MRPAHRTALVVGFFMRGRIKAMPSSRLDLQKLLDATEKRLVEVERALLESHPPGEHERLIHLIVGLESVRDDTISALTDGVRPENAGQ